MNRSGFFLFAYLPELVLSMLFALSGLWYLIFIPAIIIGAVFAGRDLKASIAGLFAATGILLSILVYQPSYRISEASLLAGVIGIPLGPVIVLLILLILSFLLAFLGTEIGSTSRNWKSSKV
ncbi:MAG: hypothetical protein ACP5NK_06775 [Thermoplasmata archaeon]